MYNTLATQKNTATRQLSSSGNSLLPFPAHANGVFYWNSRIPVNLKTRHELLLDYLQPMKGAQVRAVKRSILDHKWRFGGSPEIVSERLLADYRQEAERGSLTEAEFRYLQVRGYAVESKLYDVADTVPLAPNETNGRDFFRHLAFDGSHPEQYINEANAVRANRRTYKSHVSRPTITDHLRGFNILGPVKNLAGYYRFISFDLDRHTDLDPAEFSAYVVAVYAFLVKNLPQCAIVSQVNPKNGSTVFFCYFPHRMAHGRVEELVHRLDDKAKKEVPGYKTPEIYPIFGPGKVYLPFNPEKVTIGESGVWKQTRTKKSKQCNPMEVYSLAAFPEYVRTATKSDADTVRQEVLTACRKPLPSKKKNKKRDQTYGKVKVAGAGEMGRSPKFRGRFLRTMVDFFTGKFQPDDDTIGKYLTPWARTIAIVEGCDDFDELKERLQRCIDLIPDNSFSDRLSDDPGELERVIDFTLDAILKNNGYQARPDQSTRILTNLKKQCDRIGFVPSAPSTWATLDKRQTYQPGMELVWTPELAAVVRELAPVLNGTLSQVEEFLKLFFAWVEAKSETGYSKIAPLMRQAGIKGHNDNITAFMKAMKGQAFIEKVKNYGYYRQPDGSVQKHANFYVNTAKVVFREQVMAPVRPVVFGDGDITGTTDQPSIPPLYLLYLTFLSSDSCEYLLEYRRLTLEERYRRRIRDLYSHTWLHAGKKAA